jgi:hypothetical protein
MSRLSIIVLCLVLFSPTLLVAAEYSNWSWSQALPKEVATTSPATNRTAAAVDRLFDHVSSPPRIEQVIATLGRPDGFSRQSLYSLTKGTAQPQKVGGTLRFLLSDGNELQVRTSDFRVIHEAIRYEKNGRGNLLAK